jgi:hypothetical protein
MVSAPYAEESQLRAKPDSAKLEAQSSPVTVSEPARWIESCAVKFNVGEVVWFNGMAANDVEFMPKADSAEEIFDKCMRMIPIDPDKAKTYKIWLHDRITEVKSLMNKTRKEAETILVMNGGIHASSVAIYSHSQCYYLKVRIEFEPKGTVSNKDDKIRAVSIPYLGLFVAD